MSIDRNIPGTPEADLQPTIELYGGDGPNALPERDPVASAVDRERARQLMLGLTPAPVYFGRFALRHQIGSGGMGEVFAAYDETLGREIALKLVLPTRLDQDTQRSEHGRQRDARVRPGSQAQYRLLREAQALARLSHPNVVQVYEAGMFGDRVYIAMEYVRGPTLRAWLKQRAGEPSSVVTREVLAQFLTVGRGLAAIHHSGHAHRDFKPENVLVGEDGRPRVLDLGLARVVDDMGEARPFSRTADDDAQAASDAGADDGDSVARLVREAAAFSTCQGQVMGTQSYMSPEQLRGDKADSRSDQFSFCVALYEALYQRPPFPVGPIGERLSAIEVGCLDPLPSALVRAARVPASVHAAILRGLAAAPDDRYPDMESLLDALDPTPRRRRYLALLVLVAVFFSGSLYALASAPETTCAEVAGVMDTHWNSGVRRDVERAVLATGVADGDRIWHSAAAHLDGYASDWKREHVQVCEHARATPGLPPSPVLAQRAACLDAGRRALSALVDALADVDAEAARNIVLAAESLPQPSACSDASIPLDGLPLPPLDQVDVVAAIQDRLAEVAALTSLGREQGAIALARSQLVAAENTGYEPVRAEALFHLGRALASRASGGDLAEATTLLLEASDIAEGGRYDALVAEVWNELALAAYHHEDDESLRLRLRRAAAATHRIGDPPALLARVLRRRGLLHFRADRPAEAERDLERALEVLPGHARVTRALYLHDLGNAQRAQRSFTAAATSYHIALDHLEAALGTHHALVGALRFDLAMLRRQSGERERAQGLLISLTEGADAASVAAKRLAGQAHVELAELSGQNGQLSDSARHLSWALRLYREVYPPGHLDLAAVHIQRGALAYRRGLYEDALGAYRDALDILRPYLGEAAFDVRALYANLAEARLALGDDAEALEELERVHASPVELAETPLLEAFLLGLRGRALYGLGRMREAQTVLERALARYADDAGGALALEHADAAWAMAQLLAELSSDGDARARELAAQAGAVYRARGPETRARLAAVERWLAAH
ncbi:protein kinase domain-containing protein [Haliangium ochraceum]|uniref:non-specific serine/threonine protein kinase n=1 Tax=Haliangium ochraceum (strain DSM 14365 / JCM 11303 / SMP-2) TaxID=502025 RepID=D0LTC5_HALO1|nr:serine/threonine-protein kinase [Haliangium ochraceum]ACY13820.1 serine/threonine protein kinase with TPR repeats [Haliangium ochraceum DSM 14365]